MQQQYQYSMINQYENQSLTDSHHKHQCQVYDDLSTLMQIFKKLLATIQDIAFTYQKQTNKQTPREKLKQFSKTLQGLLRKYSQQSEQFRIEARTFQRFVCRLIETIEIYQLKYRNSYSFEVNFIIGTLNDIESAFKENECMHDFVRLIRTIKIIVEKFAYFQFSPPAKGETPHKASIERKINILDKMDTKMIRLKFPNKLKIEEDTIEKGQSDEEDNQYDEIGSITNPQKKTMSLPISHSISSDLLKRFELYRNLDVDFSNFKASYFSAKSNSENFYREYLERNLLNSKIIKEYNDDFNLFQKKKLLRNQRRGVSNRQPDLTTDAHLNQLNQSQQFLKPAEEGSKVDKIEKRRVAVIHNQNFEDEEREDDRDKNKTSYKMNHVYLTFGKKPPKNNKVHGYCPNFTPNILKNKHQYPNLYLNQSFCPKNQLSITQSIDINHHQLKIISGIKVSQRIKTSPDKNGEFQSQKIRIDQKSLLKTFKQTEHIPFRAVNKRRYIEVDCTSKEKISLNKVILTGNNHPKHLKLRKINEQKSNNILF